MAFENLLSRLFGSKETDEPELEPAPSPAPEPLSEPKPPPVSRLLTLPPDHGIHQLWSIRCKQAGWLPTPELRLEPLEGGALSAGETKRELLRLQSAVNSTVSGRLLRLQAGQNTAQKAENPPPLPNLDAQVTVFTSSSLLHAWLLVYPPSGNGAELTAAMLDQALKEADISYGLNKTLLDSLPEHPERYFHLFPVASGEPAVNGVDGKLVDLFPRTREYQIKPDENNRVDYTALDIVHNVEEGGIICKIFPPTPGKTGRTVQDKEIPARDGRPAAVPMGRHTQVTESGDALVASITGHVEFSGRSFQVKPLLEIPGNVDFSTGNVDFLGDVTIHGDIRSGFTVRAVGNIKVGGVVEACTVEAGGDLLVAGGVQGDNQAVIRAQRNIFAKYLENASAYAKDSIQTDCLINCNIYCDGEVQVRTGRMTIIGGSVRAAHVVSAGTIGSRVEGRTDIILGGQPCGEFDHDILIQEIQEMEREMEKLERQPDSPNKLSRISKTRMLLLVNRKKLEQIEKDRALLEADLDDPGVRRLECGTIYPGTVLSIGDVTYRFDNKTLQCTATLEDGEICLM